MRVSCLLAIAVVVFLSSSGHAKPSAELLEAMKNSGRAEFLESTDRSQATNLLDSEPELREQLQSADYFQRLKTELSRVEVDGTEYYVVEGDRLLDQDELALYADVREAQTKLYKASEREGIVRSSLVENQLVGIVSGGRRVRWTPGTVLSYTVLKQTFRSEAEYEAVVENMLRATIDWEALCGVDFDYKADLDNSMGVTVPDGALFAVRGINASGVFIASAFFPNDPPTRRRVLIDPSYFETSFDKVGVLRHELGHVLGYRHEHIRSEAPAACPNESVAETIPLTAYDPNSVMHYFCGGVGSPTLQFTEKDRVGAQLLYGPPASSLVYVTP